MRKIFIFFILIAFVFSPFAHAQKGFEVVKELKNGQSRFLKIEITEDITQYSSISYGMEMETPIAFTSFGIGWKSGTNNHQAGNFQIMYRVKKRDGHWSNWKEEEGYFSPQETEDAHYWTDLLFGFDEYLHHYIEFIITPPFGETIESIRLSLIDLSSEVNPNYQAETNIDKSNNCPEFPPIISRSDWCGSYTACHNPTYSPTYRNPTHAVIHHGAAPDTYTDGHSVVRSYWYYHTNNNGWSDIGYNYLTDKFGNLFLGRHNPQMPNADVQAAHAGNSNPHSIGINFLGNSDVTYPTPVQLETCNQLLAWWFDHKDFDPLSSANIVMQTPGSSIQPRICGHRDVNPGGTTCPGDSLYNLLGTIRLGTKQIIDNCSAPADTLAPSSEIVYDNEWQNDDFLISFNDHDNEEGSGVNKSFYQVLDFDGENWYANGDKGFFYDNFNTDLATHWTTLSGNWSIENGSLKQSNEAITNPNIYTLVNQSSNNSYLYHWQMKISGSGANRRAGIFFYCSEPSATYRGDAYMVYFRVETNKIELYKASNGTISGILKEETATINADTWMDIKIVYEGQNGDINIFINNEHKLYWRDSSPLNSGSGISFRTGNCIAEYDDFKVYKSRGEEVMISTGLDSDKEIRYESINSNQEAGRVKTLCIDNAKNWSEIAVQNIFTDFTKPSTNINIENEWQTGDFLAQMEDSDNLSGIDMRFFQVIEKENESWKTNPQTGFFYDKLEEENSLWTSQTGTWSYQDNVLKQTNEQENNSNYWAFLQQDLSDTYLYEFDMKVDGTHSNSRAGFHYFCDNPSLDNRGNSYFIWFRYASKDLEFYKVNENVFSLKKHFTVDIEKSEWYNIKLFFNRINGETKVYINDILSGVWVDENPFDESLHQQHSYISFRSGNAILSTRNLNTYRSRESSETITVGGSSAMIQNQSIANVASAKIKSFVIDKANNFSTIYDQDLKIDFTKPNAGLVIDGDITDVDTSVVNSSYKGSWANFSDIHSGIVEYKYSLGTNIAQADIVPWTSNNLSTSIDLSDLNLETSQTYFLNVCAKNGAGLWSDTVSSNGIFIAEKPLADFSNLNTEVCEGQTISFENTSSNYTSIVWYFQNGEPNTSQSESPSVTFNNSGTYEIKLIAYAYDGIDTIVREVNVNSLPTIVVESPLLICLGDTINLSAQGAETYLWSGGSSTVSPQISTTYFVTGTSEYGCNSTAEILVNVENHPEISINTTNSECGNNNGSANIITDGDYTYQWDLNAGGGNDLWANNLASGTYQISVCGEVCTKTYTFTISDMGAPEVEIWANNTSICLGESVEIYASGAENYLWSGDSIQGSNSENQIIANPETTTTYIVQAVEGNCSTYAEITIEVNTPTPLNFPEEKKMCMGNPVELSDVVPSGGTYSGNGVSNNVFSPSEAGVGISQIYYEYTNEHSCISNCTYTIEVLANPQITCSDIWVCAGSSAFQLDNAQPSGGVYSGNAVENNIFDPNAANSGHNALSYIYHDENNCSSICSFIVEIIDYVNADFALQQEGNIVIISNQTTPNNAEIYYNMGDGNEIYESSFSYTYLNNGEYTIKQLANNQCFNDSTLKTVNIVNVGINDNKHLIRNIYPNPASDNLNIDFESKFNGKLEIYNALGQRVLVYNLDNLENVSIDISKFASNIYFLKLSTDANFSIHKFVIKRDE
ncbi:MAG: N-acetylmuramoyl-L-alanine amidase [Bacteroidales bacterium]|nr:T9SS type A sorting domain-containing protein [Bacteroidales bacterium]